MKSVEQAVATALGQLSSSEQALVTLTTGPSEAEVAELRSAVTQAQLTLYDATRLEEESSEALTEDFDAFCDRYGGLIPSDEVISSICSGTLPLLDEQIYALEESYEDRSATYESLGDALIASSLAFVAAVANRESAVSVLSSAEERLSELLEPASEDDVFQAEQTVEAARASHAAAVAKLEELQAVPGEEDEYQAQQAVRAARASHAAAEASLEELRSAAEDDDIYQAEQTIEAAKASHDAAVARLEELRATADEADIEQARASLESAQASLGSAQAHYDELVAGPSENAIEQQRQDLRLAELSAEEARAALAELTVVAPFDGVVEAVNVQPGD